MSKWGRIKCALGFHDLWFDDEYIPHIKAEIITEYKSTIKCARCGHIRSDHHLVWNPKTGEFITHQGPLFANLVLADEVNRAPGKVQSALLEEAYAGV